MIVKVDGEQVEMDGFTMRTWPTYQRYQSLTLLMEDQKFLHKYDKFGKFGYARLLLIFAGILAVAVFFPAEPVRNFASTVVQWYPLLLLVAISQIFIRSHRHKKKKWGKLLPTTSETGYPLDDAPYTKSDALSSAEDAAFEETYYNMRIRSVENSLEQQPLKHPVIVDGQRVIGAYVELHIDDERHAFSSDYRIQLESGLGVQVDGQNFRNITSTIYTTEAGDEFLVPVLTGRHQSLIWGAFGDTMSATEKMMQDTSAAMSESEKMKPLDVVEHIRPALRAHEFLLSLLRKEPLDVVSDGIEDSTADTGTDSGATGDDTSQDEFETTDDSASTIEGSNDNAAEADIENTVEPEFDKLIVPDTLEGLDFNFDFDFKTSTNNDASTDTSKNENTPDHTTDRNDADDTDTTDEK